MDVVRPLLALIHVGSALLYVTGFASAKTLTGLAAAESDAMRRGWLLGLGDRFDFRFQILGGTLVGLSGIPLTLANGYSLTQAWVVARSCCTRSSCSSEQASGAVDRRRSGMRSMPEMTTASSCY
jgi:hypothetical protein